MNPLDLRGPEFLRLYLVLSLVAVVLIPVLWRWLRMPGSDVETRPGLTPHELAWLSGGAASVVELGLAELVNGGQLDLDAGQRRVRHAKPLPAGASWVAREIHALVGSGEGRSLRAVDAEARSRVVTRFERLVERGFHLSPSAALRVRVVSILPLLVVMALGTAKVAVGMDRHRPVANLVLLLIGSLVPLIVALVASPRRTTAGDRALEQARKDNTALREVARHATDRLSREDFGYAVALYGIAAVASPPIRTLRETLRPAGSDAASSGTAGCGSSGGGSCGGGCGGGGCGGCGS